MSNPRELEIKVKDGDLARRVVTQKKPSRGVIETIADIQNTDSSTLEPLYDVADPDALNALFRHTRQGEKAATEVSFTYAGYDVTISDVIVARREDAGRYSQSN